MSHLEVLDAVAASQHGLATRQQLMSRGVPARTISHWVESKRLIAVHRATFRAAGTPVTDLQRVLGPVLAVTGSAASHRAAAWNWNMRDDPELEISVERPRRVSLRGVTIHRSRAFERGLISLRNGIRTTNPLLTLLELGDVEPPEAVRSAVGRGLATKLFTVSSLLRFVEQRGGRGCHAAAVLREIAADLGRGLRPTESELEVRMARVLRLPGFPAPVLQFEVVVGGRVVARVDFAYPAVKLAVEVDGWEFHGTPQAMQRDLDRQNALVAAGWTVLRFTWRDVLERPDWVAAQVMAALARLGAA